jgi:hypothetical protein
MIASAIPAANKVRRRRNPPRSCRRMPADTAPPTSRSPVDADEDSGHRSTTEPMSRRPEMTPVMVTAPPRRKSAAIAMRWERPGEKPEVVLDRGSGTRNAVVH